MCKKCSIGLYLLPYLWNCHYLSCCSDFIVMFEFLDKTSKNSAHFCNLWSNIFALCCSRRNVWGTFSLSICTLEGWVSIIQSHCSEFSVYSYVSETFIFIIFKRDFYLLQSALIWVQTVSHVFWFCLETELESVSCSHPWDDTSGSWLWLN